MSDFESDTVEFERPLGVAAHPAAASVKVAGVSHPGRVRSSNEDHFAIIRRTRSAELVDGNIATGELDLSLDHAYLIAVADGLGGNAFGEVASQLVLRTIQGLASGLSNWIMRMDEHALEDIDERVNLFVDTVRKALAQRAAKEPELAGMATTLTLAYTMGLDAVVTHVGDSRAYLIRHGTIEQVSRDHTLYREMVDAGHPEELARPFRNRLTRVLSTEGAGDTVDITYLRLQPGDRLLMCSDGLSDMVADGEILATVMRHKAPRAACAALLTRALDNGGLDNVTVAMAAY